MPNNPKQLLLLIMHPLSASQKAHIISLITAGHSSYQVSSMTGVHSTTISRLSRKHFPYLQKSSGGRPSKLSDRNVQHGIRLISSGKAETAVDVTKSLQDIINQPLSAQTTRRYMKKAGMKAVVKKKKPLLTTRHKRERLDFAVMHKDWTVEDWKRVIWSDETKINRLGSDGRKWAWKKAGEGLSDRLVSGTVKFGGGSVMVWGCMTWEGPGLVCKIDGRMDGDLYLTTMTPNTPARRPSNGSRTMKSKQCYGQHNLQTSTPLNNCGLTLKGGLETVKHPQGYSRVVRKGSGGMGQD